MKSKIEDKAQESAGLVHISCDERYSGDFRKEDWIPTG